MPNRIALSFRDVVIQPLVGLLTAAGFPEPDRVIPGLIAVVDSLKAYTEEGKPLFPELVITTSIEGVTKPLPYREVIRIGTAPIDAVFEKALKVCAPIAIGDWAIWIDLGKEPASFGVLSVTATELSPTLRTQIVGTLVIEENSGPPAVYVRSVGSAVELAGKGGSHLTISSGLTDVTNDVDYLGRLVDGICADIPSERRTIARAFFYKMLEAVLRDTNGCMLAVISPRVASLDEIKQTLADGVYLNTPIDFIEILRDSDQLRNRESSTRVRASADLLRGMITQDGITLLSSDGKLLGYRVFVPLAAAQDVVGGARKRAFAALEGLQVCANVFSLSHDGSISYCEPTK